MMDPTKAKLYSGQELADLFGLTFGQDKIEAILNQASAAKFNEMDKQTAQIRDRSLTDQATAYNQYAMYNRKQRDSALKNGMSKGSSIAAELAGQLQAQKDANYNQTSYQQQLGDLTQQRGSQMASDKFTAMNTQNTLGMGLGTMSVNQQGNTVQENAAYQSYAGQVEQANAQRAAAQATRDAAASNAAALDRQTTASNATGTLYYNNLVKAGYSPAQAAALAFGDTEAYNKAEEQRKKTTITPKLDPAGPQVGKAWWPENLRTNIHDVFNPK